MSQELQPGEVVGPWSDLIEEGMAGRLAPGSPEFERFIDMTARRPSGEAVQHYRDPTEHYASFETALRLLELATDDRYLELCFGGGQLLESAMRTVASAAGIDHSPEMLALACERNVVAVVTGRLQLAYGDVHSLPWGDGEFSKAACVNAFFFIERPLDCLREARRVLRTGGTLVIVTAADGPADDAGPWGPALRTYSVESLSSMLRGAGFSEVTVEQHDRGQTARAVAQ